MIKTDDTTLNKFIVHKIGSDENHSVLSNQLWTQEDEDSEAILKKLLLNPFVNHAITYEFAHEVNIEYNVLFGLVKGIFEKEDFIESSKSIAQHLIATSKHANINDGDLFVAEFDGLELNGDYVQGIGIYKFEEKENFLETSVIDKRSVIDRRKGLSSRKPDKACLILLTEEPYTLLILDNNSKSTDYWQNDFIKHKPKNDFVNNTTDFLTITKSYITDQLANDFEISKADQIDLLNRSVDYFKKNETFVKDEFEEQVFNDSSVIDSFRRYDQRYKDEHELELEDNFQISAQAVKKQQRVFKSVLKLDKNFHVYIHGNRDLIERGVDDNGRKYYKIYYEEES